MAFFAKVKRFFLALLALMFISSSCAFAFLRLPFSSNKSSVSNIEKTEIKQEKKAVKQIKKIYKKYKKKNKNAYENIINNAPKNYEDYLKQSEDVKRDAIKIPSPKYEKDPKLMDIPEPTLKVVKYNFPAGTRDVDLTSLISQRKVDSIGVISPDLNNVVYSSVYYYPNSNQVASEMYVINLDSSLPIKEKLRKANTINQNLKPILKSGIGELNSTVFKTLVLVDWSADSKKVVVKEKIGSNLSGVWKTNLWVYDFDKKQAKELNEVREAIRYYWRTNEKLDLTDYMWDIFPVGWDASNPDRIIVYAFAYTSSTPKFLGTWSVDSKGASSQLLSLKQTDFAVSTNGLCLRMVPN